MCSWIRAELWKRSSLGKVADDVKGRFIVPMTAASQLSLCAYMQRDVFREPRVALQVIGPGQGAGGVLRGQRWDGASLFAVESLTLWADAGGGERI